MKTLVNHSDKSLKINIDMSGDVVVTLPGGEQVKGKLSEGEREQLAFRLFTMSEGKVSFDPEPTDLLALHDQDMGTLERQAEALNEIRDALQTAHELGDALAREKTSLEERLTLCETDLVDARTNLKDARQSISELQEMLDSAVPTPEQAKTIMEALGSAERKEALAKTVHNERSEVSDTEPPSAPDSTVHNERPTQPQTNETEMPLL